MKTPPNFDLSEMPEDLIRKILRGLATIPGGYEYHGCFALQVCFPLKAGGELRFCWDDDGNFGVDLYEGTLPPCITGPSRKTG
jgi:hypothetical protein